MPHSLPSTPAEVLDISTPELREILSLSTKFAELSGNWRYPLSDAATDIAEMELPDICYWAYKCTHPVTHFEKGERIEDLLMTDQSAIGLPEGFEKQQSLTLGAAGDILQADGLEQSKDILFENIADLLFDQDVAYANLKSPITTQPLIKEVIGDRGPPTECCSRAQFEVLKGHKGRVFDVLNTSNNHAFDMGVEGLETTLGIFAEEGILETGTNRKRKNTTKEEFWLREALSLALSPQHLDSMAVLCRLRMPTGLMSPGCSRNKSIPSLKSSSSRLTGVSARDAILLLRHCIGASSLNFFHAGGRWKRLASSLNTAPMRFYAITPMSSSRLNITVPTGTPRAWRSLPIRWEV